MHDFAKNKINFTAFTITGNQPQCKPITCGQPPEVLNARFYLTNGTSTAWQSLARYSCKLGFKMVYQDSKYWFLDNIIIFVFDITRIRLTIGHIYPLQNVYLWTNICGGHRSHKTSNVNILASFPTWFAVFFLNKNNIVTRIRLLTRLSPHSQQKKRNLSLFWTCSDGYIIATTSDISDYCLILLFVYGVWDGKQKKMCT